MIKLFKQSGKKVGIFGLARTGISVYESLLNIAQQIICFDDNEERCNKILQQHPDMDLCSLESSKWEQLDLIVLSPGISVTYPAPHPVVRLAKLYDIPIKTDIELLFEEYPHVHYVGITGTNGKSTTTKLTYHMLRAINSDFQLGGNIGIPVLSLDPPRNDGGFVLELSSYQLYMISQFRLDAAVILNITPDHLDHHGNLEEYIKAKKKIFDFVPQTGLIMLGYDNIVTRQILEEFLAEGQVHNVISFSSGDIKADIIAQDNILYDRRLNQKTQYPDNKDLLGAHNQENIAAAYALACHVTAQRFDVNNLLDSIKDFEGLPHRMRHIASDEKIHFFDDSKATNIAATIKALKGLNNIFWLAGGITKDEDFTILSEALPNLQRGYFWGQDKEKFLEVCKGHLPCKSYVGMGEALEDAVKDAKEFVATYPSCEANILLSPAAASFDQFKDFVDRGQKFIMEVKNKYVKA